MEKYTHKISKILLLIFFVITLFACKENKKWQSVHISQKLGKDSISFLARINGNDTLKDGEYKRFVNNKLSDSLMFQGDKLEGWQFYLDENGKIQQKNYYKKGIHTDSSYIFFSNGQVKIAAYYQDDVQLFAEEFYSNQNRKLYNVMFPFKSDSVFYVVLFDSLNNKFYENGNLLSDSIINLTTGNFTIEKDINFKMFCTDLPNYSIKISYSINNSKDIFSCKVQNFYAYGTLKFLHRGVNIISFRSKLYDNNNALIREEKFNRNVNVE